MQNSRTACVEDVQVHNNRILQKVFRFLTYVYHIIKHKMHSILESHTSIFVHIFTYSFHLPLLTISTSKLQATHLEGDEPISSLDDVH